MSNRQNKAHETAPAASLETLHVLLDTSVYGKYVDLNSKLFMRLRERIETIGLVLHYDPIIDLEIRARIAARVTDMVRENKKYRKYSGSWNHAFTSSNALLPLPSELDVEHLTKSAEASFFSTLRLKFRPRLDKPEVKLETIMARYERKQPPFHTESSKEFPDAIIVEGASVTASKLEGRKMYLVTDDEKMLAAAETYETLLPVKSLEAFLQILTNAQNPDIVEELQGYLDLPDFDQQLVDHTADALVQKHYAGDVYYLGTGNAEAVAVDLSYVADSGPYSVIGFDDDTITCVTPIGIKLNVELEYEVPQPSGSVSTFSRAFETDNRNRAFVIFQRPSGDIKSVALINPVDFDD